MNRKQKRLQQKMAKKKGAGVQANDETVLLQSAGTFFNSGQFKKAALSLEKVLRINPDNFDATNALAIANANLGKADEALVLFEKTTFLRPDDAVAHYNYARSLQEKGDLDKAVDSYRRSVDLDPQNAAGLVNLGNLLHKKGDLSAHGFLRRAIEIDGNFLEAHLSLGSLLKDREQFDQAADSFSRVLAINPNVPEAVVGLASVSAKMGQLEQAASGYLKALSSTPGDPGLHYNYATLLQKLGHLDQAIVSFQKALTLAPRYAKAWNNYKFALKAHHFLHDEQINAENGFSQDILASSNFALLEHYLDGFRPHESQASLKKAIASLPAKTEVTIPIGGTGATPSELPDKMVALLLFGRSGTGLMHSLIDNHPDISTLPGVYMRGYFNEGVWDHLAAEGWRALPERFVNLYEVLFDANSAKPVPSRFEEVTPYLGRQEGMTAVGENRDEALSLDRDEFCRQAHRLMEGLDRIDPAIFFRIIHAAIDEILGTRAAKKAIFYHIHNPDEFAGLNFHRWEPDAQIMTMVREPVQNCESSIRLHFENEDYGQIVHRIIGMLFGFDRPVFQSHDSVGVRLEDLKARPQATMAAISDWIGVEDSPTLYEMTAQGKKWWGDPSSPDYTKDSQMSPFDDASIRRPIGKIFSDQDQLVFRTLFYPFSVRFGYEEANPDKFKGNLAKIRPLLDDMLDFEKAFMEKSNSTAEQLKADADYTLLRASLIDRWDVLDQLHDYPNMIKPLEVG